MSSSNKVIVENMVYRGQGKPCRSCFFIRGLQGIKRELQPRNPNIQYKTKQFLEFKVEGVEIDKNSTSICKGMA